MFLNLVLLLSIASVGYGTNFNTNAEERSKSSVKRKFIYQPLDHFDTNEKRSFKIRYFEDRSFWKPNSPIYLSIGGEGNFTGNISEMLIFQIAGETNGLVVAVDHRYYGDSPPPLDLNKTENYKFLSSRQALADLARLIEELKSDPEASDSKVIVTGCSYPGNLATWMRISYPHLVHAAVSSCAPLHVKKNFFEAYKKTGEDYNKYGPKGCNAKIAETFKRYEKLLESDEGIERLKQEENICQNNDMTLLENKQVFFNVKIRTLVGSAQLGGVNEVRGNCSKLIATGRLEPVDPIFNKNEHCYDYSFSNYVNVIIYYGKYGLAWNYQLCTEFGYFPTTDASDQIFTDILSVQFHVNQCTAVFGPDFDEKRVDKGIESNQIYGGLNPNVTNILFVNGDADIWSPLSILKNISTSAQSLVIPDHFHCDHVNAINKKDPQELVKAKRFIIDTVKKWL